MRFLLAAFLLALALPARALDATPEELVGRMSREVLDALRADKDLATGDRQKGIALAEQKILPYIDFEEATRLAVGRGWSVATAAQKEKLVREFRAMLVRTYSSASAAFQGDGLRILPMRGKPQRDSATVRTHFLRAGAPPLPIEFHARKTEHGWKIFDIVVEGVSLVLTYRSEFDAVARQEGVDGLIRRLAEKNATRPA
jgi:phospholipid transport system substrate-binding protein